MWHARPGLELPAPRCSACVPGCSAHGDLTEREQELLRAVFYLRNKGQVGRAAPGECAGRASARGKAPADEKHGDPTTT